MTNKAFTILELVVIITVVAIMTVILFADYNQNGKAFALERSAQRLSQDLRRAQDMAAIGLVCGSSTSTNGYGIYFATASDNEYIIYCNEDTDMGYTSGDIDLETVEIEDGIEIYSLLNNSTSVSSLSVSFEPPDPLTYINNSESGQGSIGIRIKNDSTSIRTISVNSSGMIEVTK